MIKISRLSPPARHNEASGMVVERSVGLYTYSVDITQQQEHFPEF